MKPDPKGKLKAVAAGAGIGGLLGSSIGIAGAFGAISGVLPLALIGAYAAHRVHRAITSDTERLRAAQTRARAELVARRGTPAKLTAKKRKE